MKQERIPFEDFSTLDDHGRQIQSLQENVNELQEWKGHVDNRLEEISLSVQTVKEEGERNSKKMGSMEETFAQSQRQLAAIAQSIRERRTEMKLWIAFGMFIFTVVWISIQRW